MFELRIRHTAAEIEGVFGAGTRAGRRGKVLLRVFCHAYGDKIVLLVDGYDKAEDPSERRQRKEILLAGSGSWSSRSDKVGTTRRSAEMVPRARDRG